MLNVSFEIFSMETTFQTDKILEGAILIIYNSFGQVVKKIESISGSTITLYRDNLKSGIYLFSVEDENKIFAAGKVLIID